MVKQINIKINITVEQGQKQQSKIDLINIQPASVKILFSHPGLDLGDVLGKYLRY